MKTFLVPTDFSDTAKNAARYAVNFAGQIEGCRVVLFHIYDRQGYGSDGTPLQVNEADERYIAMAALNNHRAELLAGGSKVPVEVMAHAGDFNEEVEAAVKELNAGLVIMGINDSNALDKLLIGSATLRFIKRHICPVLIVPETMQYNPVTQVAFASDLQYVDGSTPAKLINDLCSALKTPIHVVHTGGDYDAQQRAKLAAKLEGCNPQFHFPEGTDFAATLNNFVTANNIGLVIMVPRQHDFFENLFKKSHTQVMAYESKVPIIAVHESLCGVTA